MRTENKLCRRFLVPAAFVAAIFIVLANITSGAFKHRGYVAFQTPTINAPCKAAGVSGTGRKDSLRLLVSYVFFETDLMGACEISNKRNNLATFLLSAVSTSPPDVHFVFTFPGRIPGPLDILQSSELPHGSDSGKAITEILSNGLQNVELRSANVNHPAADLCHHHTVILDRRQRGHAFDYVLVLNDGVRGPFFNAESVVEMV